MTRFIKVLPVIAGAVAGAIIALLIASGSTTKTVIEQVASPSTNSIPTSNSKTTGGLSVNQIYKTDSPGVVDITATSSSRATATASSAPRRRPPRMRARASSTTSRATSSPTSTSSRARAACRVNFQDGVSVPAKVLGTDPSTDVARDQGRRQPPPSCIRSRSRTPTRRRSETRWSRSAARSDCLRRPPRASSVPSAAASWPPTTTRSRVRSRPTRRSTPVTPAARCSTRSGQVLGLNDQIQTNSGDSAGVGFATPSNTDAARRQHDHRRQEVEHPYVGVCLEDSTTTPGAEIATSGGGSCTGGPIVAGSPGRQGGSRQGDVSEDQRHDDPEQRRLHLRDQRLQARRRGEAHRGDAEPQDERS